MCQIHKVAVAMFLEASIVNYKIILNFVKVKYKMTLGIEGYDRFINLFIESNQTLDFHQVCADFIDFLPEKSINILDVGSGAGQNSAALAKLGYKVTAVEPMLQFLVAAKHSYKELNINWLSGSLPELSCIAVEHSKFDFVLIDAVWHHLNEEERGRAAIRLSQIINSGGSGALSLRNGPAGMGTRVFPTKAEETIAQFQNLGFRSVFQLHDQPSFYSFKQDVKWSRIVLEKD